MKYVNQREFVRKIENLIVERWPAVLEDKKNKAVMEKMGCWYGFLFDIIRSRMKNEAAQTKMIGDLLEKKYEARDNESGRTHKASTESENATLSIA